MLMPNLLVLGKVLQKSLLRDAMQKIGLLVVVLGKHHVQHDVPYRVQQLRHVLGTKIAKLQGEFKGNFCFHLFSSQIHDIID